MLVVYSLMDGADEGQRRSKEGNHVQSSQFYLILSTDVTEILIFSGKARNPDVYIKSNCKGMGIWFMNIFMEFSNI